MVSLPVGSEEPGADHCAVGVRALADVALGVGQVVEPGVGALLAKVSSVTGNESL